VLLVVGDEVVQREAVMRGDEVDAGVGMPSGAGLLSENLHVGLGFRRQHENRHAFIVRQIAQFLAQRDAVQIRHVDIGQHQIRTFRLRIVECSCAIRGLHDRIAGVLQGMAHHLAYRFGIVHRENDT
jgi:hypothetical protein